MIAGKGGKMHYDYRLVTQYSQEVFPSPDYWTTRLELYMDEMNDVMSGVILLAGFYSKSWLRYFWWSADEMNDFRSSVPFALFTDIVVGTHLIDCEPLREANAAAYQINTLGPNLVRIQCLIGADGAFNYITQYTFDVSKTDQKPLILSKLVGKIVSPDSFRTLQIEALPGTIISKLANKNPYVKVDFKNPSMCPYLILVYKTKISIYPWAVYSCQDLNILSQGDLPRFTSYRYNGDNILWVDRKIQIMGYNRDSIANLDLSKMSMLTAHTMHNSTIQFLKAFDFNYVNITLKTLNGNTMLKRLGLLCSSFMTPFQITFSLSPWIWFPLMLLALAAISYIYIVKDVLNDIVKKYFFGKGVMETLEYLNPNHIRPEDIAPVYSNGSISDEEDLQSEKSSSSTESKFKKTTKSKKNRKAKNKKIEDQEDRAELIDEKNSSDDDSSWIEDEDDGDDDDDDSQMSVSDEDRHYNYDEGSVIQSKYYTFIEDSRTNE